jgi:hypothetical protein
MNLANVTLPMEAKSRAARPVTLIAYIQATGTDFYYKAVIARRAIESQLVEEFDGIVQTYEKAVAEA